MSCMLNPTGIESIGMCNNVIWLCHRRNAGTFSEGLGFDIVVTEIKENFHEVGNFLWKCMQTSS